MAFQILGDVLTNWLDKLVGYTYNTDSKKQHEDTSQKVTIYDEHILSNDALFKKQRKEAPPLNKAMLALELVDHPLELSVLGAPTSTMTKVMSEAGKSLSTHLSTLPNEVMTGIPHDASSKLDDILGEGGGSQPRPSYHISDTTAKLEEEVQRHILGLNALVNDADYKSSENGDTKAMTLLVAKSSLAPLVSRMILQYASDFMVDITLKAKAAVQRHEEQQKVNNRGLVEKTTEIAALNEQLRQAKADIASLEGEVERYRTIRRAGRQ